MAVPCDWTSPRPPRLCPVSPSLTVPIFSSLLKPAHDIHASYWLLHLMDINPSTCNPTVGDVRSPAGVLDGGNPVGEHEGTVRSSASLHPPLFSQCCHPNFSYFPKWAIMWVSGIYPPLFLSYLSLLPLNVGALFLSFFIPFVENWSSIVC